MTKTLPKRKMIRYCLSDIAKGLFNGMIGNYLLYFFQPTVKSGIPLLLPQNLHRCLADSRVQVNGIEHLHIRILLQPLYSVLPVQMFPHRLTPKPYFSVSPISR